jgi:hypothetical protein
LCVELGDVGAQLPRHLDGQFDVVYTTCGVLGWLPDLKRWAKVAAHFVRPGGVLYVAEIHPIAQVWDDSDDIRPGELRLRYPYWEQSGPIATPVQGSYRDRGAHVDEPAEYTWQHSLGEIVTAVAEAGLHIEFLHEFPFAVWPVPFLAEQADRTWRLPGELSDRLPLFFSQPRHRHVRVVCRLGAGSVGTGVGCWRVRPGGPVQRRWHVPLSHPRACSTVWGPLAVAGRA